MFIRSLVSGLGAPGLARCSVSSDTLNSPGYLLSSSTRNAQAPLAPFPDPVDDPVVRHAYHADERVRNTHNMLYSDGLIDFRSIVRMEPPSGSSETPFERQAHGEDQVPENDALQNILDRLTRTQLVVVLDSEEIVWLEVRTPQPTARSWLTHSFLSKGL